MNSELYLAISLLFALVSAGLLLFSLSMSRRIHYLARERFRRLLNIDSDVVASGLAGKLLEFCNRLGLQRIYANNSTSLRTMINQAGIYRPEIRAIVHSGYVVSPWIFAILAAGHTLVTGNFSKQGLLALVWGAAFGYLTPRYGLRYMAEIRRRKLREEALVMVNLLQMLFEAGLSIEQSLRTLRSQAGILLPHMHFELDRLINRIEAGMAVADVLTEWANDIEVREVTDLAEMLSQLNRQGGNIQKSLADMVLLMEDRNRTELREKVGKLSGKMTVVMVVFLFPALMIFVAGPAIVSITTALGGLR